MKAVRKSIDWWIHYLENYIDFQRFRYERFESDIREKYHIWKHTYISNVAQLVENSFKYSGVGVDDVLSRLTWQQIDSLSFDVVNSKRKKKPQKTPSERSGVGLANVSKRLELLYPDCYTFHVKEEDNLFSISLKIDLRKNNY